jgi:hypothetical protein
MQNLWFSEWLGLFFDPEDGGDMSLRKVGGLSTDYTALYIRRQNSSTLSVANTILTSDYGMN